MSEALRYTNTVVSVLNAKKGPVTTLSFSPRSVTDARILSTTALDHTTARHAGEGEPTSVSWHVALISGSSTPFNTCSSLHPSASVQGRASYPGLSTRIRKPGNMQIPVQPHAMRCVQEFARGAVVNKSGYIDRFEGQTTLRWWIWCVSCLRQNVQDINNRVLLVTSRKTRCLRIFAVSFQYSTQKRDL